MNSKKAKLLRKKAKEYGLKYSKVKAAYKKLSNKKRNI